MRHDGAHHQVADRPLRRAGQVHGTSLCWSLEPLRSKACDDMQSTVRWSHNRSRLPRASVPHLVVCRLTVMSH